jgi:hypothetical protein
VKKDLIGTYMRLRAARFALCRVGYFEYRPHDATQMQPETGARTDGHHIPSQNLSNAAALCDGAASDVQKPTSTL